MISSTIKIFGFVCCIVLLGIFFLQSNIPERIGLLASNTLANVIASQQTALYNACIESFDTKTSKAHFSISKAHINIDDIEDAVLLYTDDAHCGSGGCQAEFCISEADTFVHVPFGFAAHSIEIQETITNQMHDVLIKGNSNSKMIWDGSSYILEY